MHIKNRRGQSTVEYILLVTAVIAVMIAFSTSQNGILQNQLNGTYSSVVNQINTEGQQLSGSYQAAFSSNGVTPPPPYTVNVAQP